MRLFLIALSMLLLQGAPAQAAVSVRIGIPGIHIGINVPAYPRLVRVPGHPVYYDPRLDLNLFFYDGLYWVLRGDDWYVSSWYDGPWDWVDPYDVPVYLLRVPVRYYRVPPPYFRGWYVDAPPRWSEHWGRDWQKRRDGWDSRDNRHYPPPAPLPNYQRDYSGDRYPREQVQQRSIRTERYRYEPRESMTHKYYQGQQGRSGSQDKGRDNRQDDRRDDRGRDHR